VIVLALALALASAYANAPVALGPTKSVAAATRAARTCGMRDIRFDPLDGKRAVLLMGNGNSLRSVDCTSGWIHRHWSKMRFEPLFVGNEGR
jgi:hypothetical protein